MSDWESTERRVEAMQQSAEKLLTEVMASFSIRHVVAAFSGGDDSVVTTHWTMERFPDALVMSADTQIGLNAARDHQRKVCRDRGYAHCVVAPSVEGPPKGWDGEWHDGRTSYEEAVLNYGFPGPGMHHRMYQRLKQRAFRKVRRELGRDPKGSRILVVSGIRHDESALRAGYKRAFHEEPTERFVWFNPFYFHTAGDFESYRQEFGLPRNPVKRVCGISGECCCGAFAVDGEREAYKQVEPAFTDYLDRLEQRVRDRFPWSWGQRRPKWFEDANRGQSFMFDAFDGQEAFMPACVGCHRKRNPNRRHPAAE